MGKVRVSQDALVELAMAGGSAVVQAAGKEGWEGFRRTVARWFGRGDAAREQTALERLDRTAADLSEAGHPVPERAQADQATSWQARFRDVLENLPESERDEAIRQLREVLDDYPGQTKLPFQHVEAHPGATAIGIVQGTVSITNNPLPPDPA
jgi:hypothetical protein